MVRIHAGEPRKIVLISLGRCYPQDDNPFTVRFESMPGHREGLVELHRP